jgi:uncharacterized protein (TIGR00369 family)
MQAAALTTDELTQLLSTEFPEAFNAERGLTIEHVAHGAARVRQAFRPDTLRPGGTISGPAMMTLVDVTMYIAVLASIGWVPLAVTTQLNINFLRRPRPGELIGEARLLKLGKRLAVGEVTIYGASDPETLAHATATYSIPNR